MAPLKLNGMRKNLLTPEALLNDFPKPQGSSLIPNGTRICRLNIEVLILHQRRLNHFHYYQLLEIFVLDLQELIHFLKAIL